MTPPPYPRTPRLVDEWDAWAGRRVDVEEKLDGANVALWWQDGSPQVMGRGGPDAMDRGGQLGRLRAWAAEHREQLAALCAGERVAYGEWVWRRHGVAYDRLPDLLIVLDLWLPTTGFVETATRDRVCASLGLHPPPSLATTHLLTGLDDAARFIGVSRWGSDVMEGIVVRDGNGRRAKVVRPGYRQRSDDSWARGPEANLRPRGGAAPNA